MLDGSGDGRPSLMGGQADADNPACKVCCGLRYIHLCLAGSIKNLLQVSRSIISDYTLLILQRSLDLFDLGTFQMFTTFDLGFHPDYELKCRRCRLKPCLEGMRLLLHSNLLTSDTTKATITRLCHQMPLSLQKSKSLQWDTGRRAYTPVPS
jgi:hypothetical protein